MGALIYTLLYLLSLLIVLPFELAKRPEAVRARWLRERLGLVPPLQSGGPRVWVHAVSVGEVIAAVPLVKKIAERHPGARLIVSTVTDTGQKVAHERMGTLATVIYVPFDLPFTMAAALRRLSPALLVIMETELWPVMVKSVSERSVPVALMNGRISERSFKGYLKLRFFIGSVLRRFSLLCVQNELYAERLRSLGANPETVRVIGSFKFDTRPPSAPPAWTRLLSGPVLIAGSTHGAEEKIVLDAYRAVRKGIPALNLIVAPRHPERFREVEELLRQSGLPYIKRSQLGASPEEPLLAGTAVLLDAIGELSAVYGAADIAVMGGSFIPHGGQNPLEPAYWGKALLCGPHMENFPFIEDFYRRGGALRVEAAALGRTIEGLLADPEQRERLGASARRLYEENAGATERAMALLEQYLGSAP